MTSLLDSHRFAVRIILRYLSGTLNHGLLLFPSISAEKFSLMTYSDLDWASDLDHMSTYDMCIFFGLNLISWNSKKQSLVARSSVETEYHALAHSTSDL